MKARISIALWLWMLVLLPSTPLLAFLGYSTYKYSNERQRALESTLTEQAEDLARNMDAQLERFHQTLLAISQSRAATTGDVAGLYNSAIQIQRFAPSLSAISLVDGNDNLVFITPRPPGTSLPVTQLDSVHEAFRTGKSTLSNPFKSPTSDRALVALNVPILKEGKVVFCLRGIFRVDTLSNLLKSEGLPTDWIGGILDKDEIIVARSRSPEQFVGKPASAALLQAIRNHTNGVWKGFSKEGIEIISTFRSIGNWGWTVSVGVPLRTLNEPLRQELFQITMLSVCTLAVLALTVATLNRFITSKLEAVAQDARDALSNNLMPTGSTRIRELDDLRDSLTQADMYRQAILEEVQVRTAELNAAKRQITEFARQQQENIENERMRIAREVHDQIGALFTGIYMLINGLPATALPDAQRKIVEEAINQGMVTVRRITAELRPPLLDDLGLQSAVEAMARTVLTPAQITNQVALSNAELLSPRQTIACYRIVQEAVTNVLRHSRARICNITGQATKDGRYVIEVIDDGIGAQASAEQNGHFGLVGMRERARLIDGELQIESSPGRGFLVRISLLLAAHGSQHA